MFALKIGLKRLEIGCLCIGYWQILRASLFDPSRSKEKGQEGPEANMYSALSIRSVLWLGFCAVVIRVIENLFQQFGAAFDGVFADEIFLNFYFTEYGNDGFLCDIGF